jgi:uncharacterized protein (DUF58 family)
MSAMWFKSIFNRKTSVDTAALFDEAFLRRLERMGLQAQRTLRGYPAGGEHLSLNRLPTAIFSDHRPYSPGDDFRHIDWNAYAHHQEIVVKLGEVEQSVGVHVLLDVSRSMSCPSSPLRGAGDPPKLRAAQRLAAALGYLALAHNDRLSVAPFGVAPLQAFGPAQGKGRLIELLKFIERLQPDQPTALASALLAYARDHERGGLLVICSDLLSPEGLEQALRALPPPRWQTLVLHLLDQRELRPELAGPVELEDAETGQRLLLTLDAATLAAYRRNITAWQERLAASCVRRGATYARVLAHWPLEQQVVPYLRARRILQ